MGARLCQMTSEVPSSLYLSCVLHTLTSCSQIHPGTGPLE